MEELMFYMPFIFFLIMPIAIIGIIISNRKVHKNKLKNIEVKYIDTVEKYYNILIKDPIINEKRNACKKNNKIGTILIVCGFLSFFLFSFLSMAMIILGIIIAGSKNKDYTSHYKENIMRNALKEHNSNLTYYPTGCIPEELYLAANFEHYDRYSSEDRINGTIDGNNFMMADIHVEDRRKDSDGDTHYVTLFHGPIAIISLPEKININLAIVNNRLNSYNQNLSQVEIDNPIFEEIYNVFSDNQITAMRILTPSVTNKILDLYKKYDFKFEVKIINNTLYFRFHSGELFVPNYTNPREEAIGIALYFEILNGIEEMMKEFIKSIAFLRNK